MTGRRCLWKATIVCTLIASGCACEHQTPAPEPASRAALRQWCQELTAFLLCDTHVRWGLLESARVEDCRAEVLAGRGCDVYALVNDGRREVNPESARQCLDQLRDGGAFWPDVCRAALSGLVPTGGACSADDTWPMSVLSPSQCLGGICKSDGGCPGTCVAAGGVGSDCAMRYDSTGYHSELDCTPGVAYCDVTRSSLWRDAGQVLTGTCRAPGPPGSPCDSWDWCDATSFCDEASGLCEAPRASGARCTASWQCRSGLHCAGGATSVCTESVLGAPCLDWCRNDLVCDRNGACAAYPLPLGAPCRDSDCGPDAFCPRLTGLGPDGGRPLSVCTARRALGMPCEFPYRDECEDLSYCLWTPDGGFCMVFGATGEPCGNKAPCKQRLMCDPDAGVCLPISGLAPGAACSYGVVGDAAWPWSIDGWNGGCTGGYCEMGTNRCVPFATEGEPCIRSACRDDLRCIGGACRAQCGAP